MPFLSRPNGVKLYYEDTGSTSGTETILLFTHGFGSGSALWDSQFNGTDRPLPYRLVRWDMRGHAKSDSPSDPSLYGKHHQVADMKAILDACGAGASRKAVLIGHSMGGCR